MLQRGALLLTRLGTRRVTPPRGAGARPAPLLFLPRIAPPPGQDFIPFFLLAPGATCAMLTIFDRPPVRKSPPMVYPSQRPPPPPAFQDLQTEGGPSRCQRRRRTPARA